MNGKAFSVNKLWIMHLMNKLRSAKNNGLYKALNYQPLIFSINIVTGIYETNVYESWNYLKQLEDLVNHNLTSHLEH